MTTKTRTKTRAKARVMKSLPAGYRLWDAANYLKSEEDMAGYLEAAMEEAPDDPAYLTSVLNDIARARGMVALAKQTGMTRAGLYKALSEGGNPSFVTVLKVVKALGLKLVPQKAA